MNAPMLILVGFLCGVVVSVFAFAWLTGSAGKDLGR